MDASEIIRKNKQKRNSYMSGKNENNNDKKIKYLKNLISRVLLSIIFILGSVIFTNLSQNNKELYQKVVLEDSLEFRKINEWYQGLFGNVDIIKKDDSTAVFFNTINYTTLEKYKNGVKLKVNPGEIINVITSGIVVFMGEKDNLGNTIIIQGNDGVDIWYSNITDTDINIYDYVEAGSILGLSNSDYIYLTINKDGKYISYEEYQEQI